MAKIDDPIDIIETFKDHPSIFRISQKGFTPNSFSFKIVSEGDVYGVINTLDSTKAYQINNIPPKNICTIVLRNDINRNIDKGYFPVNLKNADITPIFKKYDRLPKMNYRPVSILSQRIMKTFSILKFTNILIEFSQSTYCLQDCLLFM